MRRFQLRAVLLLLSTLLYCACGGGGGGGTANAPVTPPPPPPPPAGSAPTVHTLAASGVTADNAALAGTVTPNGADTQAWFEWGVDNLFLSPVSTAHAALGSTGTSLSVDASLSGLAPGRTYYFRTVAANGYGTARGEVRQFATASAPPRPCTDCHGGTAGDNVNVVHDAPVVTRYWTSSGHGRYSTSYPQASRAVTCDDCHDLSYLSEADHRADGTAGSAEPPGNINTLTWPGKATTSNTAPTANTAHLKSSFFPSSPATKADFAWAFGARCAARNVGCHTAPSHVGTIHPKVAEDNVLTFGRSHGGTPPDPKSYPWYTPVTGSDNYAILFYESHVVWLVDDLTTLAGDAAYPDSGVNYGVCISCHDPHGTSAPVIIGGASSNKMLRAAPEFTSSGQFCNLCHGY